MNESELASMQRTLDPIMGEFFRGYLVIGLPADTMNEGVFLQSLSEQDALEVEEQILAHAVYISKKRQAASAERRAANGN